MKEAHSKYPKSFPTRTLLSILSVIYSLLMPLSSAQACAIGADGEIIRCGKKHDQALPENLANWAPLIQKLQDRSILAKCLSYLPESEIDPALKAHSTRRKSVRIILTDDLLRAQKLDPTVFQHGKATLDSSVQTLTVESTFLDKLSTPSSMRWNFVLIQAAQFFPKVRVIEIVGLTLSPQFFLLLKPFKNLERLSLSQVNFALTPGGGSDSLIPEETLPLKQLWINQSTDFSPHAFHHLAKRLPFLEEMSLSFILAKVKKGNPPAPLDLSPLKKLKSLRVELGADNGPWIQRFTSDSGLKSLTRVDLFSGSNVSFFTEKNTQELLESLSTFPALNNLMLPISGFSRWIQSFPKNRPLEIRFIPHPPGPEDEHPAAFSGPDFKILEALIPPYLDQEWAQTLWAYTLAVNRQWAAAVIWALKIQEGGNRQGIRYVAKIMSLYAKDINLNSVKFFFENLLDRARHNTHFPLPLGAELDLWNGWLYCVLYSGIGIPDGSEPNEIKEGKSEVTLKDRHSFYSNPFQSYENNLKSQQITEIIEKLESLGGVNAQQWTVILNYWELRQSFDREKLSQWSEKWWKATMEPTANPFTQIDRYEQLKLYRLLMDEKNTTSFQPQQAALWAERFINSPAASHLKLLDAGCSQLLNPLRTHPLSREVRLRLMDLIEPIACSGEFQKNSDDETDPLLLSDLSQEQRDQTEALIREQYLFLYSAEEIEKRMRNLMHISPTLGTE